MAIEGTVPYRAFRNKEHAFTAVFARSLIARHRPRVTVVPRRRGERHGLPPCPRRSPRGRAQPA